MRKEIFIVCICIFLFLTFASACTSSGNADKSSASQGEENGQDTEEVVEVSPVPEITELENGFYAVRYDGDFGFDEFLSEGGAASDREVMEYMADSLLSGVLPEGISGGFGCSTISVKSPDKDVLFGRNFDWNRCNAMAVAVYPENGYDSISTVNMDFITQSASGGVGEALESDRVKTLAALYAPLDGMNEAGLAVSVNMIQDYDEISQDTGKPDLTTTTAIRLLLNQAADVEEAVSLLSQYDLHGSMGMMIHFAISDSSGRSVAVEYVGNEMVVTETPVLTNFYIAEGEKYGIGTEQSHERYKILTGQLEENDTMTEEQVRDALDSVSKDNFGEFESTEWSVVYNLSTGEAKYYHREDYTKSYLLSLEK